MLKDIGLIYRKEMWTAFRERRTLIFLFLFPLVVWPTLTLLPALLFGGKEKKAVEESSRITLIPANIAPQLEDLIESSNRLRLVKVSDTKKAVSEKKTDCLLYIDSLSSDSMILYTRIIYDATRVESKTAANKVELLLTKYEQEVVSQRLAEQGIDEKLLTAISTSRENLIKDTQMIGFYLGIFIGMFIVMGSIMGASAIIIDATAGEKERKTLELLLTAPISRSSIMIGKYLAGVTFAFISPVLTAIGMTVAASFILPSLASKAVGINFASIISFDKILMTLAVILLTAFFITAFLMAIAVRAHSNRQAQTFLAPLNILVVIPVIFMNIIPAIVPSWMFLIPFMNVMLVLRGLIMGNLSQVATAYTLGTTFVLLFIALRFAAKGFGSEKVLLR